MKEEECLTVVLEMGRGGGRDVKAALTDLRVMLSSFKAGSRKTPYSRQEGMCLFIEVQAPR